MHNKTCNCCNQIIGTVDENWHCVPPNNAQKLRFPQQECPKCKKPTIAHCMLGFGHFVFTCKKCHHKWSNI